MAMLRVMVVMKVVAGSVQSLHPPSEHRVRMTVHAIVHANT